MLQAVIVTIWDAVLWFDCTRRRFIGRILNAIGLTVLT